MQLSSPPRTLTVPTIEPIVLRDGSVATLRLAQASDRDAMHGFFRDLSPASRYTRFFTPGEPSDAVIDRFCDSSNPKRRSTLLATRTVTSQPRIVGVASYFRMDESTAEVAFAVDDRLHGKGIATAMLKRLAALAANSGFTQLWATTLSDNRAMMDVFRDSGFPIRSNLGCIDVVFVADAVRRKGSHPLRPRAARKGDVGSYGLIQYTRMAGIRAGHSMIPRFNALQGRLFSLTTA